MLKYISSWPKSSLLLSLFLLPRLVTAQTDKVLLTDNVLKNHLDSSVNICAKVYMSEPNSVGLSIGIFLSDKSYTYNYGELKKGSGKLPTANTFYGIGSIDKTFATTLLAQAVEEKRIKLNDDIRKYLPIGYSNLEYEGTPIRFVNLANHTSGLPNAVKKYSVQIQDSLRKLTLADQVNFYSSYSADSLLADLYNVQLDTIPGTRYRYNNNDIKLLILLIERIYGQSYGKLLSDFVNKSLNMGDTRTELSGSDTSRVSTGYFRNKPENFLNLKGFFVGPTVVSTTNDMLKYIEANLSEKNQAIKLTHQKTWTEHDDLSMGLGWMIGGKTKDDQYIYHDGNTRVGYNSICIFYPKDNLGIIIMVNETNSLEKIGDLANEIKMKLNYK
jgi:CubicO group peptidase (beta-lactamase class C family)